MSSFKSLAFGFVVALSAVGCMENVESDEDLLDDEESDVVAEPQAWGPWKSLGGTYKSARGFPNGTCKTPDPWSYNDFTVAKFNTGSMINSSNHGSAGLSNIGSATQYSSFQQGGSIRVYTGTGFSGSSKCIKM